MAKVPRSFTIEEKTDKEIDRLARRFNMPRSRIVQTLLDDAISDQAFVDFLMGGPKNFDRLISVLRWAVDAGEVKDRDFELVKVAFSE